MKNSDNRIIQSFWYGPELSVMELLCIKSFLHHGHEFHLYCYEEIANIPDGCILFDANLIVESEKIFYDSNGGISGFANYFRIHLLYLKGGWWVDMDMICLKPFDFNGEYCFCSENRNISQIQYTNCCIKSPAGSEFLEEYIQIFNQMLKDYEVIPWLSTGPVLINKLLNSYDSKEFIQDPVIFCPVNYFEIEKLVQKKGLIPSKSFAIHLYNEMWRRNKMDKNKEYSGSSIYELLKRKYLYQGRFKFPLPQIVSRLQNILVSK